MDSGAERPAAPDAGPAHDGSPDGRRGGHGRAADASPGRGCADGRAPDSVATAAGSGDAVDGAVFPAIGVAAVGMTRPPVLTAAWVGAVARVELTVTDADTAQAVGSGEVPVLATPRLLALAEAASVGATLRRLPTGTTTVAARVELEHRLPTAIGRTVVVEARLIATEGRRLTFEVSVRESGRIVAVGWIERVLVDRHRFVQKALDGA